MLENLRVVLVQPSHPGNIGATARAMKNMGLSHLALVKPREFPSQQAALRASGADDVLAGAWVVESLEEALTGCRLALAASARARHLPWPLVDPRQAADLALQEAQDGGQVALVFGREHAGLTNEELQRCHYHVQIPSDPAFASLNLGAAVQVLVYELRMAWLSRAAPTGPADAAPPKESPPDEEPCALEELESFYRHLQLTLAGIGFLDPQRPRHLMARLRRLYGRAGITRLEMNILRGILTETDKAARGEPYKR